MKLVAFSSRTAKEILRDPLNLCFGIGFPVILILLLSAIQANIPVKLFEIGRLSPGIAVFGMSFLTLFSASLVAKDRESAFLQRLYTAPMKPADFIFGYTLPMLPLALAQSVLCYLVAVILGLDINISILYAVLSGIPAAVFFIAFGLLCGSVLGVKQVGGICGALFTNVAAWLSGTWFDLELVGGAFKKIAYLLPFAHAVELERAVLSGSYGDIFPHIYWVAGYAAATLALAVLLFLRQMRRQ